MSKRSTQKTEKKDRKVLGQKVESSTPTPLYPSLHSEQDQSSPQCRSTCANSQQVSHTSAPSSSPSSLKFHVVSSAPRTLRDSMRRGRNIKPQRVLESTLVGSVAGFVYDAMPQSPCPQAQSERIEWVNFQKYENAVDPEKSLDIIVFGLTRGFQIWAILENCETEEIVTERQGPVRIGRLLTSTPVPSFGVSEDRFSWARPLFAVVDASTPTERLSCTLSFLSLITGQYVHRAVFPDQICAFEESSKVLVISFSSRLVICDAMSFHEQRCIYYPSGPVSNIIFAVSDIFIAFADSTFVHAWQSCGGMMTEKDVPPSHSSSYASSVVNAASSLTKVFSSWSESVVSSFSSSPNTKDLLSSLLHPGIVSVSDVTKLPVNGEFEHEGSEAVLAHFVAQNESIGYLKFGHGGRILLTAGLSSTCFNIFLLHPHPVSSALGAAQHIYTLNRGTTPAKVVSCAFSLDNRFVALATNHGTTHLFAICPYGGSVTMRTHGNTVVNKDSRYHRSTGFENTDVVNITEPIDYRSYQFGAPQIYKDHPSLIKPFLARSARNPRVGPYSNPLGLTASGKLRDSLSVDNLSAWASDITAPLTTGKKRNTSGSKCNEPNRLSVIFASNSIFSEKPVLLVAGTDGIVTEYLINVKPRDISTIADSDVQTASHTMSNGQVPIKCKLCGSVFWQLQRGPTSDMRLPLSDHNPFLVWLRAPEAITRKESLEEKKEAWMSQIEVFTYSEPYRRLWNLPQFEFVTFKSDGHTSADLVAPARNKSKKNMKAVPVVIEAAGSLGRSYEVYGSVYGDENHDEMVETLKDALREVGVGADSKKKPSKNKSFDFISYDSQNSSSSSEKRSRDSADRDSLNLPFGAIDP